MFLHCGFWLGQSERHTTIETCKNKFQWLNKHTFKNDMWNLRVSGNWLSLIDWPNHYLALSQQGLHLSPLDNAVVFHIAGNQCTVVSRPVDFQVLVDNVQIGFLSLRSNSRGGTKWITWKISGHDTNNTSPVAIVYFMWMSEWTHNNININTQYSDCNKRAKGRLGWQK